MEGGRGGIQPPFQGLFPTPYNPPTIRGRRDKNFEDPMQSDQDMRKTRHGEEGFLSNHPLSWSVTLNVGSSIC